MMRRWEMYWSGRFWGVLKDMLRSYIMFLSACGARIILYFLYVLRFFWLTQEDIPRRLQDVLLGVLLVCGLCLTFFWFTSSSK